MTAEERVAYYHNQEVRERIVEFLGGNQVHLPTCRYIIGGDESGPHLDQPLPIAELESLLDRGLEIGRSLWDGESLLADFDVEYVNFDHPAEPFIDPERIFELLQPVAEEISETLQRYEIPVLRLVSGRGHHFVSRIRRNSAEFRQLVRLGRGSDSLWQIGNQSHLPEGRRVSEELSRAFAGLGLLMEFLAHGIKRRAAQRSAIPVELTAFEVGPSSRGREMISIDLSEYGDPLHMRMMRGAFTVYLKPWQQPWAVSPNVLENLPPLFIIPMQRLSWRETIPIMRHPGLTTELAHTSSAKIPDATAAIPRLINDYEQSKLAEFHRQF